MIEQIPRLIFVAFSIYGMFVLITRWQVTRVMTVDRRFLFLFFILELSACITSGVLKIQAEVPVDVSSWMTVLSQSFLAAYLYYSVPSSFKRAHYRITRRRKRR